MKEQVNKINLRSEITQEILSRQPSFAEKNALYIFLGVLLSLIAASWFIRYPDIVRARASLTAINGPREVIPREGGPLIRLFVHNGDGVEKDQAIGWLESSASHQEILDLSRHLDSSITWLNEGNPEKISHLFLTRYDSLGEIQQSYRQFISAYQQFNDYMVNGFYQRKKKMLFTDLKTLDNNRKVIEIQQQLAGEEIKNAEESHKMSKWLMDEKVISKEEFREATSKFVNKQMTLQQVNASLLSNETGKNEKLKELDQLDHDLTQQKVLFQQALTSLKSLVDAWRMKYIIAAPAKGKIFFTVPLQEFRFITQGKLVGYIVPDDSRYYINATLSQVNFGKLDTGQKVQIRFDAYPYQENGFVEGTLNYVSNIASDSGGFLATIRLDNGLATNNHKVLPYKNGLKADAVIITRDVNLLQRLTYNMTKISFIGN